MAIRVGINGFGRIGRLVYRAGIRRGGFEFLGVNDLVPSDNLAYLLNHDIREYRHNIWNSQEFNILAFSVVSALSAYCYIYRA